MQLKVNDQVLNHLISVLYQSTCDELVLNDINQCFLLGDGAKQIEESFFPSKESMTFWLQSLVNQLGSRLDPLSPSCGGSLFDGVLRWHCVLGSMTRGSPLFSLRRHRFHDLSLENFVETSAHRLKILSILEDAHPLIIFGPTGCGKTSLLVSLMKKFLIDERIFILESLEEIPRLSKSWVHLYERLPNLEGLGEITLSRTIKESLRLCPDRIIVGEIRGSESGTFLEANIVGHGGGMTTIHAGSPMQAVSRLMTLSGFKNKMSRSTISSFCDFYGLENLYLVGMSRHRKIIDIYDLQTLLLGLK